MEQCGVMFWEHLRSGTFPRVPKISLWKMALKKLEGYDGNPPGFNFVRRVYTWK